MLCVTACDVYDRCVVCYGGGRFFFTGNDECYTFKIVPPSSPPFSPPNILDRCEEECRCFI